MRAKRRGKEESGVHPGGAQGREGLKKKVRAVKRARGVCKVKYQKLKSPLFINIGL